MTLTRRGRKVRAVSYTVAAVVAFGAGATAQLWDPYTRTLDACRTVDLPEDTTGTGSNPGARLIAAGWYGDPTDHAERLYSPACR